jgi:hypothetical protein
VDQVFVNSEPQVVTTGYQPISYLPGELLMMGAAALANGCWGFQGSIDDLAIYNRALTLDEIQTLYLAGGSDPRRVLGLTKPIRMSLQMVAGEILISLRGQAGDIYTIEASSNLVNWNAVGSVTNIQGSAVFREGVSSQVRFYRASTLR